MCASLFVTGRLGGLKSPSMPGWVPALVILSYSLPFYGQNSAVGFVDAQPVPLANACSNAFAGHFHRGAKLDLVTTCTPADFPGQGPFTAVLLSQDNGTYKQVEDGQIDGAASPVLAADLNGDGVADLIVNPQFSSTIGVQLSNGDGTFQPPVYYNPSALNANAVLTAAVSGDFNGDGKNDVAIITTDFTVTSTIKTTNTLTIFLNNGSGTLKQAASYVLDPIPANENAPLLVAGKLDGDNESDLAVVYRGPSGVVVPYFATVGGAFRRGATYHAGPYPVAAAIGNLTTGGYGDIAITTTTGVSLLLGTSAGTFDAGASIPYAYPVQTFGTGAQLVLADFDNDGILDLALSTSNFVFVYWGEGNAKFSGAAAYSVPLFPLALMAGDMNGDGREDLISAGQNAAMTVLYNQGHRSFRAAANTYSPYAAGIVSGDFNRDGKQDVAVVNTPPCAAPCKGAVTVFAGSGSQYFNPGKRYAIGMHGSAIAAGDLNGDGIPDLVVTNATAGDDADVSVLLGVKGGGFAAAHNYTLGSLSNDAFLIDVNKDSKLDLVEDGGVALGKGDGTFGPLKPFPDGIGFGKPYPTAFSMHLAVGDLNGDGFPDVVASYVSPNANPFATQVWVLLGNGKGNFTGNQLYDANGLVEQVVGVAIGKLETGGKEDIVLANNALDPSGNNFGEGVIFLGDGKGNFQESAVTTAYTDGGSTGGVAIADFNHDGIEDIGISSADEFAVGLGKGGGMFTSQVYPTFPITSGLLTNPEGSLAVADFTGDGWPDVVFTNFYGITRLYNDPVSMVSPGSLTWGDSGTRTATIRNTLKTAQTISVALADPSQSAFTITANSCKGTLAPGAGCTVTLEYVSSGIPTSDTLYMRANGTFIGLVVLNGD